MKFSKKMFFLLVGLVLLAVLVLFLLGNVNKADTPEEVIALISDEIPAPEKAVYAGEFVKGEEALLWFIMEGDSTTYYRAVDCKLLSHGYRVREVLTPSTYAEDIVYTFWNCESIWLINDTDCSTIVTESESGTVIDKTDLQSQEIYPYIYHHNPPSVKSSTRFLDGEGNEIS